MGSRERDLTPTPHQPHLSSLVVRPSDSGGGSSDYEPGEVTRDPPYSRSDRFHEDSGHRMRAASDSPLRYRKVDHHYRSDFDNFGGPHHGRGFRGGRGPGRFRDSSPPYGRGRGGGRSSGRGYNRLGFDTEPFRAEGMIRNNPNVSPREGDWICSDPSCGNLNFARREFCNNCNRPRFGPSNSPRRNYPGPPPRFSGPPMDRSPGRGVNGYRSPPRDWGRNGPRDFRTGPPHPPRNGGRFPDHNIRRERSDYREEDYRERVKFDRPVPPDWGQRDRGRDHFNDKRGYGVRNVRRSLSPLPLPPPPPPPPPRGRWVRDIRERSRSPMRGGPPKDYRRNSYVDRGRGGQWGMARDRMGEHPY